MHFRSLLAPLAGAAVLCLSQLPAAAQGTPPAEPVPTGFWERPTLLGDAAGFRPFLARFGVTLNLTEISEVLGNLTGGIARGAAYDGLTTATLGLDTGPALGWQGGTFQASALQIHGRNLSVENLASLQTASGIEASRGTRLWELWFQQQLAGDAADVKLGQQSLDQEFMVSQYSALFVNTVMGWPMLPSADLYAGGPAYPLSALGLRLRGKPAGDLTLLAGIFDDNPPGGPFADDAQLRGAEASGTRFNLGTGALAIAELQYAANAGDAHKDCTTLLCGLPGTYKLGFWYDSAPFADQHVDQTGLSLADPASSGVARRHPGNFSFYGLIDQQAWREAGGPRMLGAFLRVMGAPADRNLIDWSLDAGFTLKAPLPGRDSDTIGIAYGWAHVSPAAAALDRDTAHFTGAFVPVRGAEHLIEATYQAQLAPWWVLQPDLQYVVDPGGGIANPHAPSQRVGDELVVGLRTTVTF